LLEDIIHLDTNVKRFKEMVRALKKIKMNQRWRFGFQNFPISKDSSPYLMVKDVRS